MSNDHNYFYDVMSHPGVRSWFLDLAKKKPFEFLALTRKNKAELENLFGRPSRKTLTAYFWEVKNNNLIIRIKSSSMGTTFHVFYHGALKSFTSDPEIAIQTIAFLKTTLQKMGAST